MTKPSSRDDGTIHHIVQCRAELYHSLADVSVATRVRAQIYDEIRAHDTAIHDHYAQKRASRAMMTRARLLSDERVNRSHPTIQSFMEVFSPHEHETDES